MTELTIRLPAYHAQQRAVAADPAKRKVVRAGRRWGKTTYATREAVERVMGGSRALIASTTQEQADASWDMAKRWLIPLIDGHVIDKNETLRLLTFPNGGRLRVKTARDSDTLRGDYADFLVLDECAYLDPKAWDEVGAPMLLDNDGDALFLSTPKRVLSKRAGGTEAKGARWFRELCDRGKGDGDGRWRSWQFSSHDNPHLSKAALGEIVRDMPGVSVRQEIEAEFVDIEGALFQLEWFETRILNQVPERLQDSGAREPLPWRWVRFWDLATSMNSRESLTGTALVGMRQDGLVCIKDVGAFQKEWPDVRRVMATTTLDEDGVSVGVEQLFMGQPAVQELYRLPELAGRAIWPVPVQKDKFTRALPWAARASEGKVVLIRGPWIAAFLDQLVAFPDGEHDDMVDAVSGAMVMLASVNYGPRMRSVAFRSA